MVMKKLLAFSLFIFASSFVAVKAQSGIITTLAGNGAAGYNGDNRQATTADLNQNSGVAVDVNGNVYVADYGNFRIRKIATTGVITTFAGDGINGYAGNGGQATAAKISYPECVRVDSLGNVYFSDAGNALIWKVNTSGVIKTIAGIPGTGGYSGNGGQATAAELNNPVGLALDKNLNVYVADQANNVIRKIATTGIITTVAGNHVAGYSGNGGQATNAKLNNPTGVAVDYSGNMYIADYLNNVVRKVSPSGVINAFAGTTVANFNGFSGLADTTELYNPTGVSVSATGNVYIADAGNAVVREVLFTTNQMYVIAGIVDDGYSGDGGPAVNAEINYPFDLVPDKSNNVFIADLANNRVRKITADCIYDTASVAIYNNPECHGNTDGVLFASYTSPFGPYTYSWSPGGNTNQQDSGLSAGTYTVTIKDAFGCSETSSATLTQPTQLTASATVVANVSCSGGGNGSASVTNTGGTMPYFYSWLPTGGNSTTAVALSAGTYTVTVTDNNGCTATAAATITQPATGVTVTIASHTNASCNGGTGSATANTATGGSGPYTYSWTPSGGSNLTASNLSAGTYTITATDNHGCTGTASVAITQPALGVTISIANHTNVSCFGGTGTATANAATGGSSPYTYAWAPSGGTNLAATSLSAGTYTITATDNHGCTGTASVTITQPANSVSISIASHTDVSCFGGTGTVTANTATGGTSPYNYNWTPSGGTNVIATGISAGTYTITATDNHGCTATASVTITQPATGVSISMASHTDVSCLGGTGSATANAATGGTSPYIYVWSPSGGSNLTASNISAGTYTITATDNHGCTGTVSVTITQPATGVSITIANHTNVSCFGGTATATANVASGGTAPYTYAWTPNGGTNLASAAISAGTYTITATDNHGCTGTASVTITQPASALSVTTDSIAATSGCNGVASVTASGGTAPYTYFWSTAHQTTDTITGQCAGTYCCVITDNHGCSETTCVTVKISTGIIDIANSTDINLFPNPTNGQFTLIGLQPGMTVEMYDYTGRKMSSQIAINGSPLAVNISTMPNGIYLIRIMDKSGILVSQKKVVKTN